MKCDACVCSFAHFCVCAIFICARACVQCSRTRTFSDYQLWWSNCVPNFYVCIHISLMVFFLYSSLNVVCLLIASLDLYFFLKKKIIHICFCFSLAFFMWVFLLCPKKIFQLYNNSLSHSLFLPLFCIARTHKQTYNFSDSAFFVQPLLISLYSSKNLITTTTTTTKRE